MGPDTERLEVAVGQDEIGRFASGVKHDQGKPRGDEVLRDFPRALSQIVAVGTFGAEKYAMGNWVKVPHGRDRYLNAAWRHQRLRHLGVEHDRESGLLHEAHELWCRLAAFELLLRESPGQDVDCESTAWALSNRLKKLDKGEWERPTGGTEDVNQDSECTAATIDAVDKVLYAIKSGLTVTDAIAILTEPEQELLFKRVRDLLVGEDRKEDGAECAEAPQFRQALPRLKRPKT